MLQSLLASIRRLRPSLRRDSRAIVEAIMLSEGSIGSATSVARTLGLQSRFALSRLLRHDRLLPLHRLARWATVMSWVRAVERDGISLCRLAFQSRRHPSACYRLVKKITGHRWGVVLERGSDWIGKQVVNELRRACTVKSTTHAETRASD